MITLTERAATELKDLLQSQEQPNSALRVWVQGGGCSGLSYGMALDSEAPDESDQIYEQDGIKIYVDPMSLNYMSGSSVDYVDDVLGGGFKIENPNAVSGCGCGSSFKTADSEGAAAGGGCGSCSNAR
jgi:iron-sulfur cluster assembly accessory protein